MSDNSANNKRIAKNTLMLYIRMLLIMGVTLYTSRIILQALGIDDYGIYNVVGGVVAMFGFINSSLSGASSRFITYAIGKGDKQEVQATFNSIVTIHYLIAAIVFILAETIGLWFVMNKLVIPIERQTASFWVYQSAVLSSVIMIASVPFNSLIIAHERMGAFAYISIYETLAKLGIVFLLFVSPIDKLIFYALQIVAVQVSVRIAYTVYCKRNFTESHYKINWDKKRSRKIFSYAGWTMNGHLAIIGYTQGLNILLNLFFGPAVNAARGIAVQVQSAVSQFFTNFQVAVNPQITKSYAQGDLKYMHTLVLSSSRLSYYLMLLISIPILFHADLILGIWLKEVPEHTVEFVQIMLVVSMIYTFKNPTTAAIHATGDIKKFQIIEGSMLLSIVPVAYILLKFFHINPETVFFVYFIIEAMTQLVRVFITYPKIQLPIHYFFTKIIFPVTFVTVASLIVPTIIHYYCDINKFIEFIGISIVYLLSSVLCIYLLGLQKTEKEMIQDKFINKIFKR